MSARRAITPIVVSVVAGVVIVAASVLLIGSWLFGSVEPGDSQERVVEVFGPPAYFVLEYLPRDDAPEGPLVRIESWYYPDHEQVVHFIAGSAIAVEPLAPDDAVYPYVDPRLFDFEMSAEQVVDALGEPAEQIDDVLLPAEEDGAGGGAVYLAEHALFGVQDGVLLYLETFGDAGPQGGG